jgi:hypothetical protein
MSNKFCLGFIRDPHKSQNSSAIAFLSFVLIFPDELVQVLYTSRSQWKSIPWNAHGESYNGIHVLADLYVIVWYTNRLSGSVANLVMTYETPTSFLALLPGI